MVGNILILAIAFGLGYPVVKVFRSERKYNPLYSIPAGFAALMLLVTIIIPNYDFVRRPFIPSVKGILLDADTRQPISDANVLVTSYYEYSILMSLNKVVTDQYLVVTDANGSFYVKSIFRYLSFHFPATIFPLLTRQGGDNYITIWKKDYASKYKRESDTFYITKLKTRKDKLHEIHRTQERLGIARDIYYKVIYEKIQAYFNDLILETPVDTSKMYWLEG